MKEHNLLDFIFVKFNHRILRPILKQLRIPGQNKILNQFHNEDVIYGLNDLLLQVLEVCYILHIRFQKLHLIQKT